jgi:hypothetical protein
MFARPVLCRTSRFIIRLYEVHLLLYSSYVVQRRNKVKEKGLLVRHALTAFTFVIVSSPEDMAPYKSWHPGSHCAPCERVRPALTGYRLNSKLSVLPALFCPDTLLECQNCSSRLTRYSNVLASCRI